jgi:hypothetical protein
LKSKTNNRRGYKLVDQVSPHAAEAVLRDSIQRSPKALPPVRRQACGKIDMTIDDIKVEIEHAKWFSRLGIYSEPLGHLALSDLHAWDNATFDSSIDERTAAIASEMDWLPSSREEEDPIHGKVLTQYLTEAGVNFRVVTLDLHKRTLKSLRSVDGMKICSGANDFSQAAIGAALYCVRMAALEVMADQNGFWCSLLHIYVKGHWPCGLLPDKTLVVY